MDIEKTYRGQGITFNYPGHWDLSTEPQDDTVTITVGDEGAFWSIMIIDEARDPGEVLEEAVQAFQDEYDEIDEEHSALVIMNEPAGSVSLEFVAFELINSVTLIATIRNERTIFVMSQVTEHEREQFEPLFQRVTSSLQLIE